MLIFRLLGLSTIVLSIRAYIKRSAFMNLETAVDLTLAGTSEKPKLKAQREKPKPKTAMIVDDSKDTDAEIVLKLRKSAINKLFDKLSLRPVHSDEILKRHKKKGKIDSKRSILEHYDGKAEKRLKANQAKKQEEMKHKGKNAKEKGKGKAEDEDEEEEGLEMSANQVNQVFAKAVRNDVNLPEMDPPDTFALTLRWGYIHKNVPWYTSDIAADRIRSKL